MLLDALRTESHVIAAELRPPRVELDTRAGMDAWIDTYHAVRGLARRGRYVFLTDSAVGAPEEDNLRHLVSNLGDDVDRSHVVPFLTSKHTLEYCLTYADRARQHGFPALVVLGGDRRLGPARSVEHAWQLREAIRERQADLVLGGWANPHRDAATQVRYLLDARVTAEFYLSQIVSHHDGPSVAAFLEECDRRTLRLPGMFGVFYYRSARPSTLARLQEFIPVPVNAIAREFEEGASADEICARTLRALREVGVRHFYISNLPLSRALPTLARILDLAELPDGRAVA
ncbi:MAG: hypothetical protein ACRD2X_11800, partial [Vicinamibacteraceae bacterium]